MLQYNKEKFTKCEKKLYVYHIAHCCGEFSVGFGFCLVLYQYLHVYESSAAVLRAASKYSTCLSNLESFSFTTDNLYLVEFSINRN